MAYDLKDDIVKALRENPIGLSYDRQPTDFRYFHANCAGSTRNSFVASVLCDALTYVQRYDAAGYAYDDQQDDFEQDEFVKMLSEERT